MEMSDTSPVDPAPDSSELSKRELEILAHLISGLSNKAIATRLEIAEATVKIHVGRILNKTHSSNRTQAALWGISRIGTKPR